MAFVLLKGIYYAPNPTDFQLLKNCDKILAPNWPPAAWFDNATPFLQNYFFWEIK